MLHPARTILSNQDDSGAVSTADKPDPSSPVIRTDRLLVLIPGLNERYRTVYSGLIATQQIYTHAAIAVLGGTGLLFALPSTRDSQFGLAVLLFGANGMLIFASIRNSELLKKRLKQLESYRRELDSSLRELIKPADIKIPEIDSDIVSALTGKVYLSVGISSGIILLMLFYYFLIAPWLI